MRAQGFATGERVCSLVHGGGYATQAKAKAACTLRLPAAADMKVAACLPEAFLTVWYNIIVRKANGEILLLVAPVVSVILQSNSVNG